MTTIAPTMQAVRRELAARFLDGEGIEIGALDSPLPAPSNAKIRYVDRTTVAQLRAYYPELADKRLVEPDLIEDGELLPTIKRSSLDFIIANHMLEHCENPLGTFRTHLDRVRAGGILYYAIPDKRQCFAHSRPLTSFEHLLQDDVDGGAQSRWSHYLEWAVHVNGLSEPKLAEENARANLENAYSIHFHVWDPGTFHQFLLSSQRYLQIPFTIEQFSENGSEVIAILRKQ